MVELTKVDSHVEMTTPIANKIVLVNDSRSLCILTKPTSNVVYKDKRVAKDKKRSQFLKTPYIDMDKLRKRVNNNNALESQYCSFKKDSSLL